MKTFLFTTTVVCSTVIASAQATPKKPNCLFDQVTKRIEQSDPTYRQRYQQMVADAQKLAARPTGIVYQIPVVFHVLYHTDVQNLHDSVILNGLQILNKGYRKQDPAIGNLRSIFTSLAADAEVEFVLADKDPQGNATTGITRNLTAIEHFGHDNGNGLDYDSLERIKVTAKGGLDPWPTDKYLNIWIADLRNNTTDPISGLYGYAGPPDNPLPPNGWPSPSGFIDGVVMNFQSIGNNNPTRPEDYKIDEGKGIIHEVGHYLGLRHIWGDNGTPCTATADDGIPDTPLQASSSEGNVDDEGNISCPAADQNTCGAGTPGDLPDLWENYLDYTFDQCRSMFTHGQLNLIRYVLEHQRHSLVENATGIGNASFRENKINVYPQPANDLVYIDFSGKIDRLRVLNMMGQTLVNNTGNQKQFNVISLPSGMYMLLIESNDQNYIQRIVVRH